MSSLLVWQVGTKTSLQVGASGDHPSPNYQAEIIFFSISLYSTFDVEMFSSDKPTIFRWNKCKLCLSVFHTLDASQSKPESSERVRSKLSTVDPG